MAALVPLYQEFFDIANGLSVGVTKVKLVSTSDTITVPNPAHSTASAAVGRLLQGSAAACTASQTNNTVTLVGTAGNEVFVVTLHNRTNSAPEA